MRSTRIVADVARLPRTVFGHRSLMWWGTIGFIVILVWAVWLAGLSVLLYRTPE